MNLSLPRRTKSVFIVYWFFYFFLFYIFLAMLTSSYSSIVTVGLDAEVCITILLSAFLVKKINDTIFCYVAAIVIGIASFLFLLLNPIFKLILIFGTAPLFSLGVMAFFSYFQRVSVQAERTRFVVIIACTALPLVFFISLLPLNALISYITAALLIFLSCGFLVLNRSRTERTVLAQEDMHYFGKKTVFLYLLPWIIFCITNATLAKNNSIYVLDHMPTTFTIFLIAFQVIGVSFGAIMAGFMSDFFGRRITLALALTLYGVSSALGAIFMNAICWSAMYLINGITWGILFVMYIFVVWSDLSNDENCPKLYALGSLTYLSSSAIANLIQNSFLTITMSSFLTCFAVYFSIVPIFLAPEIADSDLIAKTRFERYVRKLRKIQNQG